MIQLTANTTGGPDYIALAMVGVLLVIAVAMTVRKYLNSKKPVKRRMDYDLTVKIDIPEPEEAPGTGGKLKIYDVEPKTAAMLMAIVADKTGLPLNELRFTYIKEIK